MKKIKYLIISLILMFVASTSVNAAASLNVSKSSVTVGGTFTTTVNLSNVAAWEVHVHSNGPVKNCSIDASDSTANAENGSKSYSVTCTATGTGTITLTLSGNTTGATDSKATSISGKKTVTVTKASSSNSSTNSNSNWNTTSKKKSSENSLNKLSVEGGELSPKFESGTTEYDVKMPKGTENIEIKAEPKDSKASVTGTGKVDVSEGVNKLEVVVTAENGYKKTYKLNVTVEEDSIEITIDKNLYTLVKKEKDLPQASSSYSYTKIEYKYEKEKEGEEGKEEVKIEIPAYYSEITKFTLVGLKNEEGKIRLYIYDKNNNTFDEYKEFEFSPIIFYTKNIPNEKMLKDLIETEIEIGNDRIKAYTYDLKTDYYLLYGVNVETGDEGWFQYDSKDNTIQRYDTTEINKLIEKNNKTMIVVALLCGVCFLMMFFLLIFISKTIKEKNV